MPEVRVLLRDTVTGDEAWHVYEVEPQYADHQDFWWMDGNAACDCNRLEFLHRDLGRNTDDAPEDAYPCGDGRVVIMQATVDGVPQNWK